MRNSDRTDDNELSPTVALPPPLTLWPDARSGVSSHARLQPGDQPETAAETQLAQEAGESRGRDMLKASFHAHGQVTVCFAASRAQAARHIRQHSR